MALFAVAFLAFIATPTALAAPKSSAEAGLVGAANAFLATPTALAAPKSSAEAGLVRAVNAFLATPTALAAPKSSAEAGLVRAVNATRASFGLGPVSVDRTLVRAARSHSVEMLQGNYFSHGDFHGRMVAFRVRGSVAGENLAWGTGVYSQSATIVQEWLASPEHRANLLRPSFRRIGIGLARGPFQGSGGATIVTADFAG